MSSQRKPQCNIASWLLPLCSFGFLLLLSYGFVITGDDWFFSAGKSNYGFFEALTSGIATAKKHYITTNGRLLGNFFAGFVGYSKIVRELLRCSIILFTFLQARMLSQGRGLVTYLLGFSLFIALPAAIASQTYVWAAGFFNYVPPALLVLCYIGAAASIFFHEKSPHALWMLLLGLVSQFFVENVSLSLCLLSLGLCIIYFFQRKAVSFKLTAHFVGTLIGCVIMFLAPGYRHVGTEGYREVASSLSGVLKTVQKNTYIISTNLTENNWLVVILAAVFALLLLSKYQPSNKMQRCLKLFSIGSLFIAPLYFFADQNVLTLYRNDLFWLDLLVNLAFFAALFLTAMLTFEDKKLQFTTYLLVAAIVLFTGPLLLVSPVGPRCLYVDIALLITVALILIGQGVKAFPSLQSFRFAVCIAACLLLLGNLFIYYKNGKNDTVRKQTVAQMMHQGATDINLPNYPYPEYIHIGDAKAIGYYYYYKTPGDIRFYTVPYKIWNGLPD